MTRHFDVAVVGGGIVGLAHAWMAAQRGLRTVVLERTAAAEGASIRNFGMIWPIGQPAGELHSLAMRSRELWLTLQSLGVLAVEECGSIHLAHRPDELAVQEEFCHAGTYDVRMLTANEVALRSPLANAEGLLAGMLSPTELRVDPRIACARIASWLAESHGVEFEIRTSVVTVKDGDVCASDGRSWTAERVVVCSGSDLQTLYPKVLAASGLILCKLQMLKSVAQPFRAHLAPHLASGLTLRHYTAFQMCSSLKRLQIRVEEENPERNRFGIHILVSQSAYEEFLPLQESILGQHSDTIVGVPETVEACRRRGLKIGSSTGYTRALMKIVSEVARQQGYVPDCVMCAEDAPRGRPAPYLLHEAAKRLDVYPMWTIVAVDDTPVGKRAGRNAGCWTVGVTRTGNGVGLSAEEIRSVAQSELRHLCDQADRQLRSAGAHYTVESVADIAQVISDIEGRLLRGESPVR